MPEQPPLLLVADLMTSQRRWNASLIWRNFDQHVAKKILATHIPDDDEPDLLRWGGTRSGKYSFKSGYWYQNRGVLTSSYDNEKFWKALWKLNIFPKWKHFCWKIIHRILPTKINLQKRGVTTDVACPFCNQAPETEAHIFRLCPLARMVWRSSQLGINSDSQASVPIQEWLVNFLHYFYNQDGKNEERVVQLISTLWGIWLHRNEIIFRGMSANPERILELAQSHALRWKQTKEVKARQAAKTPTNGKNTHLQISIWRAGACTTTDYFSIVVDAAWKRKKKVKQKEWEAAIGWAEDCNQSTSCSGSKKIFAHDSLQAECYAILEGTKMAANISKNVVVKTDCKEAVVALKDETTVAANILTIIQQIKQEARKLDYYVCIKVSRDSVAKAHNLAQQERKGFSV
ncbi:uncharacterized protein [Spinacia oleracea]|uniref:Reverse transcriptase zinc-binding domain-containing protein n=1 Tax=Spinacia oleracea TaxID=3562 RepID=A0ABM3QQD2_SPIOL|nr:uncharacterized protein LOC130461483 [Spinacia oleracea]